MSKLITGISDFITISTLAVIALIIKYGGIEPYQRGFYCYDTSIRHPYKSSTIESEIALSISIIVPVIYIIITEVIIYISENKSLRNLGSRIYFLIKMFGIGAAFTGLLTSIGKLTIGRLRPHFLEVCQPDLEYDEVTCGTRANPIYVTRFMCTSLDNEKVHDARLSFPSGHSSAAFYSCVFTALYLQMNNKSKSWSTLIIFNQLCLISYAWYCALTRVSDYKHHPTDVLAGGILGVTVALCFLRMIKHRVKGKIEQSPGRFNQRQKMLRQQLEEL